MVRIIEFREPMVTKLRVEGELTCEDSSEVRERVQSAAQSEPDKPVVMDLGDLKTADPCGESLLRELDEGGVKLKSYGGGSARELLRRIRESRANPEKLSLRQWVGSVLRSILGVDLLKPTADRRASYSTEANDPAA